jgi:ubiquinone/menaquinone biosynthesis C-methylase UbiE
MRNKELEQYRIDVVLELSGTGLEIGFGSGLNLPYYKNINKLYALDPSEELFEIAFKNIMAVSFPIEHLQDSAEHIPLPDNSLDFVSSTWTLCSVLHPEAALQEVFRVLKPGGKFSFVEHGKSPKIFISKIQNFITPLSRCIAGGCHMNRDIESLILDSGFEMQELQKFSQRTKPLGFIYKGIAIAKK